RTAHPRRQAHVHLRNNRHRADKRAGRPGRDRSAAPPRPRVGDHPPPRCGRVPLPPRPTPPTLAHVPSHTRRWPMRWWIGLAVALSSSVPLHASAKAPPNIVVILADDLGAHDLGCTGSTYHETPHLDRLAKRGMLFTSGYASCPVCSPTRAALMT